MNKKMNIIKNAYILFVVNVLVFISLILFKNLYTQLGYDLSLINVTFVVNLVIFVLGLIFNILFIRNPQVYDNKKSTIIIIICFFVYLLLNSVLMVVVNKELSSGYTKINSKLSSYCVTYGCDKYETVSKGGYEEFVISKSYFDYNNAENNLEIVTKYNTKEILEIVATVYSKKEMFSETLIKDNLKDYFLNFEHEISEEKIREAFDKRFTSSVEDGNFTYKVTEIYKNNELDKLKTTITLVLKQG